MPASPCYGSISVDHRGGLARTVAADPTGLVCQRFRRAPRSRRRPLDSRARCGSPPLRSADERRPAAPDRRSPAAGGQRRSSRKHVRSPPPRPDPTQGRSPGPAPCCAAADGPARDLPSARRAATGARYDPALRRTRSRPVPPGRRVGAAAASRPGRRLGHRPPARLPRLVRRPPLIVQQSVGQQSRVPTVSGTTSRRQKQDASIGTSAIAAAIFSCWATICASPVLPERTRHS